MAKGSQVDRRDFLKQAAVALGAASQAGKGAAAAAANSTPAAPVQGAKQKKIEYPRTFSGAALRMLAFPLGGVAAGSIALGGRGQLRDWEIFNRPNKGYRPGYAFPSIWARVGNRKPVARVLEARLAPPYEGQDGLGSSNVPGLTRLDAATFTGAYPFARVDFSDSALPVQVALEAFSPFIPHEPDDSGLPAAILRYRVTNPNRQPAQVSLAYSLENPVRTDATGDACVNEFRAGNGVSGLVMRNAKLPQDDPMHGTLALACRADKRATVSHWAGWPAGRWWNSPLLFWDQFAGSGTLGEEPAPHNSVGVLCLQQEIAAGSSAEFVFLLAWHFPNRTPEWCGWDAPEKEGKTVIGNQYATRFADAWEAATYTAAHLHTLEARTRAFADALHASSLPAAVRDAASANLSTLATTTCFRTADGEFHGFEGSDDARGCCFGNCTHVWNYETVTPFLFPTFARSLRRSAFGYAMDDAGAIHFRQMLPDGKARWGFAAADGQMGQIVHAWLDWKLSGDMDALRAEWPRVQKALEFAWIAGGWDANKDGVMEGVQHNTYDVEFYGPNPMCSIYYLAALHAGAEMAAAAGDQSAAAEYRRLAAGGSAWIDQNLFNGEYFIQKVRGFRKEEIAANLRSDMGADNPEKPEYQVGAGCFTDQLIGQYLADVGGLGSLVNEAHVRTALASIYRYNYKRSLMEHDNVARTYALNDEAAVVVCDYAQAPRPRIPFPYYSEAWTGLEYSVATVMMSHGMVREGIEIVESARRRFDGQKRNPWDEAECGHHYARAMSAWSTVAVLSGFHYDGPARGVRAVPLLGHEEFMSIWATGTGWGTFRYHASAQGKRLVIAVAEGSLPIRSIEVAFAARDLVVTARGARIAGAVEANAGRSVVRLDTELHLKRTEEVRIEAGAKAQ